MKKKVLLLILILTVMITVIIIAKPKQINENIEENQNNEVVEETKEATDVAESSNIEQTESGSQDELEKKDKAEEVKAVANNKQEEKTEKEVSTTPKVMTLNNKANNVASTYGNTTRIEYGTSYQGRTLEAYLINGNGSNSKTIFMECEVHGFEDGYAKDGKVLVNLGNDLVEYYAKNPENLGEYRMIVVPSANPDGVIEGVNNTRVSNGYCFGRCTANGYDMNRDFKSGSFKAQESKALSSLMSKYPMNIHLDFHGWENSVIGDQTIVNTFLSDCGLAYNKGGRWGSGQGYVIEYTKNTFGAHSAIVEFRNASSVSSTQVESAINKILKVL